MNKILHAFAIIVSIFMVAACSTAQEVSKVEVSSQTNAGKSNIDWRSESSTEINLRDGSVEITKSGVYVLSGELSEGSVTVNVNKSVDKEPVYLVLNGATINSSTTAPINIIEAKEVVVLLSSDTTNTITQQAITTTDEDFPSGAIYSKADLRITGSGTLNLTTQYNDGINSRDDLVIEEGAINIVAESDGIVGKDAVIIEGGYIEIVAGKDAIRSTNTEEGKGTVTITGGTITVDAQGDGIQAIGDLVIADGIFSISTGGGYPGQSIKSSQMGGGGGRPQFNGEAFTGEKPARGEMPAMGEMPARGEMPTDGAVTADGAIPPANAAQLSTATSTTSDDQSTGDSQKGIKSDKNITINGGGFAFSTYEDAIHAAGTIEINAGDFKIESGDDAIHSDTVVVINNGNINITASYEGIEAATDITINGGEIIVVSSDDGLNASERNGVINLNGGTISITAGGDGIDSNGDINQTGGKVVVVSSANNGGEQAVDYDGTFTRTGGEIVDSNGNEVSTAKMGMGGGRGGMTTTGEIPTIGERPSREQMQAGAVPQQ